MRGQSIVRTRAATGPRSQREAAPTGPGAFFLAVAGARQAAARRPSGSGFRFKRLVESAGAQGQQDRRQDPAQVNRDPAHLLGKERQAGENEEDPPSKIGALLVMGLAGPRGLFGCFFGGLCLSVVHGDLRHDLRVGTGTRAPGGSGGEGCRPAQINEASGGSQRKLWAACAPCCIPTACAPKSTLKLGSTPPGVQGRFRGSGGSEWSNRPKGTAA